MYHDTRKISNSVYTVHYTLYTYSIKYENSQNVLFCKISYLLNYSIVNGLGWKPANTLTLIYFVHGLGIFVAKFAITKDKKIGLIEITSATQCIFPCHATYNTVQHQTLTFVCGLVVLSAKVLLDYLNSD